MKLVNIEILLIKYRLILTLCSVLCNIHVFYIQQVNQVIQRQSTNSFLATIKILIFNGTARVMTNLTIMTAPPLMLTVIICGLGRSVYRQLRSYVKLIWVDNNLYVN